MAGAPMNPPASGPSPAISSSPAPAPISLGGPVFCLKVGDEAHEFFVHKNLLSHYPTFFGAACTAPFLESQQRLIVLDTEDPAIIGFFVQWIYNRGVAAGTSIVARGLGTRGSLTNPSNSRPTLAQLCKLWIFADRRGIPILQDDTMSAIHVRVDRGEGFTSNAVNEVYDNTLSSSALPRYLAENFAYHEAFQPTSLIQGAEWEWSYDLLFNTATALRAGYADGRLLGLTTAAELTTAYHRLEVCRFHVHAADWACGKPTPAQLISSHQQTPGMIPGGFIVESVHEAGEAT